MANSGRSIFSTIGRGFKKRPTSHPAELAKSEDTNRAPEEEPAEMLDIFAVEAAASSAGADEKSIPEQQAAIDPAVDQGIDGAASQDEGPTGSDTSGPNGKPLSRVHVEYHAKSANLGAREFAMVRIRTTTTMV